MEKKKQPPSGIIESVPRLVGASVGAAATCAKRILFEHDGEESKPVMKHARPAGKKRKKKRTKASSKRSSKSRR